ncbi:MAG: SpoIIIAH-like family protein [Dehalobacterium sp.]
MKLFTIRKRKIILSLLFVCFIWFGYLALGLNSIFNKDENDPVETGTINEASVSEIDLERQVGSDTPLNDSEVIALGEKNSPIYDDYFVNYRIEREKIRSQQIELLREIVDNPNSVSEVRKNAQEKMLTITQNMENELKLENLIKAKNYQDAVVLIQPESVMVVVKILELAAGDGTKIADMVANTTGHSYEDIIITTKE